MQDLAVTPPLFKETVFDDPSVRDLSRVGVIDIGSNSVRLVCLLYTSDAADE